jgi:hypothetical protein
MLASLDESTLQQFAGCYFHWAILGWSYSEWNLLKGLPRMEVHNRVINMLPFSIVLPQDGAHRGDELLWNPFFSHVHAAVPLGCLQMEFIEEMVFLDGIKTETKNCCHGWNEHLQTILSLFIF